MHNILDLHELLFFTFRRGLRFYIYVGFSKGKELTPPGLAPDFYPVEGRQIKILMSVQGCWIVFEVCLKVFGRRLVSVWKVFMCLKFDSDNNK